MKIVLASNNHGKLKEFNDIFQQSKLNLIGTKAPEVAEDGLTFVENAILKARASCKHHNLPSLADDSGLCVSALNGSPGIFSKRYAAGLDMKNIDLLLANMKNKTDRSACFVCVLVLLKNAEDPNPIISQGIWHGKISLERQGKNGFGYDPIFFLPELNKTAAQLTPNIKNSISHRGQACLQMIDKLKLF